jgi:hypothetical protein
MANLYPTGQMATPSVPSAWSWLSQYCHGTPVPIFMMRGIVHVKNYYTNIIHCLTYIAVPTKLHEVPQLPSSGDLLFS